MKGHAAAVRVKRVYESPAPEDGYRVLVDRLWPRGLTKAAAGVDLWLKEVAPSTELRRWFHANLDQWPEFRERYVAQVMANPALDELRAVVKEHAGRGGGGVTLLYAAKSEDRNHALILWELLTGSAERR